MIHIFFSRHHVSLGWRYTHFFSCLAAFSYGETAIFKADITEITGTGSGVTGSAVVFVPENTYDDASAYSIAYGGFLSSLTANCNDCGVHVHDGKSCADADSQGGHYFVSPVTEDPWNGDTTYTSNAEGDATFYNLVKMGDITASEIDGRAIVVHDSNSDRVACGLLVKQSASDTLYSELDTFADSQVLGSVTAYQISSTDQICLYGKAFGLQPSLSSILGGTHIHAGTSCLTTNDQQGHYFSSVTDPWNNVGYSSTDEVGDAEFTACVETGETGYPNKAFVVHASTGDRVACGLLEWGDDDDGDTGFLGCILDFLTRADS